MNVTIIRGLPGSGKSTLARKLAEETGAIVIEPDQMLIEDGEYRYSPDRYAAAIERCRMMLDLISGWDGEDVNLRPDIIYCDVLPTVREVNAILESINGPFRMEMYTMHADLPDCRNIHNVDPKDLIRFRRIFERVECPGGKARSLGKYFPRTDTDGNGGNGGNGECGNRSGGTNSDGPDGQDGQDGRAGTERPGRKTGAAGAGTGSDGRRRGNRRKDGDHGE